MSTLDFYNKNAKNYFDTTVNLDMTKQYRMFLKYLPKTGTILDFGCGSGRDTLNFKNQGYEVVAIDGSEELCKLAREYTQLDVKCMDFSQLCDISKYDGVWACSSLLHVKRNELLGILKKIRISLKEDGVLYTCFKDGNGEEIKSDGRFFTYLSKDMFEDLSTHADLKLIEFNQNIVTSNYNNGVVWNNFVLKRK
jgi:SAM-dependent methyltransferase